MIEKETSLGKALRLLMAVGEDGDPAGVSVSDLVARTGLSRPTAYRYLGELQEFGLIQAVPKQPTWRLGPKVIALAAMADNWAVLRRRARHAMEEFVREVGYTVHLGIRDGFEVVYVDKAESVQQITISSVIGQRRELHVTALGKCLVAFDSSPKLAQAVADRGLAGRTPHSITTTDRWLAEIEKVRRIGVAFDLGECDAGAKCVAAPVIDAQGYAAAAVSLSVLASGQGEIDLDELSAKIKRLADEIGVTAGV